jgi:hypothetical protein
MDVDLVGHENNTKVSLDRLPWEKPNTALLLMGSSVPCYINSRGIASCVVYCNKIAYMKTLFIFNYSIILNKDQIMYLVFFLNTWKELTISHIDRIPQIRNVPSKIPGWKPMTNFINKIVSSYRTRQRISQSFIHFVNCLHTRNTVHA